MVVLAQLVRASDCGSEGHGFEPHTPPKYMVTVVRNGSGSGCEPDDRNVLAGSSPVFHPNLSCESKE